MLRRGRELFCSSSLKATVILQISNATSEKCGMVGSMSIRTVSPDIASNIYFKIFSLEVPTYTFACPIICSEFPVQKIRSNKLPFRRAYVPEGVLRIPHILQGRSMASIPPSSRGQELVGAVEHRHGEGFSVCFLPAPGGCCRHPAVQLETRALVLAI